MTADGDFELELDATEVQAAAEGVVLNDKIEFMGETYRMAGKAGALPMLKYARAMGGLAKAEEGSASEQRLNLDAMGALYEMVRDCIDPDDWPRFEDDAISKRADQDDLNEVLKQVTERRTARPTQLPSGSSGGRRRTSGNSKGSSSRRRVPG